MKTVIFAHGKESGPQGVKIEALSLVARRHGWRTLSPDFRGLDPAARVAKLLDVASALEGELLLAGSSMGGYVVTAASAELHPAGLFLMAPALGLPAYPGSDVAPHAGRVCAVHGWGDSVVPAENVVAWARRYRVELLLVDDEHPLHESLPQLEVRFAGLLGQLAPSPSGLIAAL